jgi:hypothetical protein
MRFKFAFMMGLLSLIPLTQAGCLVAAAAGAGAGVYAYTQGELSANLDASVKDLGEATLKVFSDMKAAVYENVNEGVKWRIHARTATDHRVEVEIAKITDNASKVKIRVDNFGDEATSNDVMSRLEAKIKAK